MHRKIRHALQALILTMIAGQAFARPNILLVIADDMGLDATPCYNVGASSAKMPTLSGLCNSGMVFENAYTAPTCSPTRAAIMTGKFGFRTGVGGAITPNNRVSLKSSETSLFDVLSKSAKSYQKALIGKWHLAPPKGSKNHPSSLGIQEYFGLYSGTAKDYYKWTAVENGKSVSIDAYSTTVLTDRAVQWVSEQGDRPWFLWLAYNAPHTPFHAPPSELHSYSNLSGSKSDVRRNPKKYYFAALQALDSELGRLLDSMSPKTRKNTVVIFIGDNGSPMQVARDIYGDRGAKGSIFEGGTHVPLVISGPGIARGRTDALVASTDLFVTIAHLAGATSGSGTDSVDLAAPLKGQSGARSYTYAEHFGASKIRGKGSYGWSIRNDRYKIVQPDGRAMMMFDLKIDPFEKTDLLKRALSENAQLAKSNLLEKYALLHK